MNDVTSHHPVIIIGSGPAGLTAAIYTARANLAPLCIEGLASGGQLMATTDVENYPGYPEGIMGPEMMQQFRDQAARFGTEFITNDVTAVDFSERPFKAWVGDDLYTADSIIVSTGATAREIGVPGEKELSGYGVSYCATCDGFFFRDKEIMVVGGGDSAMEEATFLTKFASKVTIVHRRDEYRSSKIMLDRARANEKIEFMEWSKITEFHGADNNKLTHVTIENTQDGTTQDVNVDGVFVAIGHDPNTKLFQGMLDMQDDGYLITESPHTTTNIPGVFACGDVQDDIFRQAVTAAGSGCAAAIDAERWLADEEDSAATTADAATAGAS